MADPYDTNNTYLELESIYPTCDYEDKFDIKQKYTVRHIDQRETEDCKQHNIYLETETIYPPCDYEDKFDIKQKYTVRHIDQRETEDCKQHNIYLETESIYPPCDYEDKFDIRQKYTVRHIDQRETGERKQHLKRNGRNYDQTHEGQGTGWRAMALSRNYFLPSWRKKFDLSAPNNCITSNKPIENQKFDSKKQSSEEGRPCLKILILSILFLVVIAIPTVVVVVLKMGGNNDTFVDTVEVKMELTLDRVFTKGLEDKTSNEYKSLTGEFCHEVSNAIKSKGSAFESHSVTCEVTRIRHGSTSVEFVLLLHGRTSTNTKRSTFVLMLTQGLSTDSKLGLLPVKSESIRVLYVRYLLLAQIFTSSTERSQGTLQEPTTIPIKYQTTTAEPITTTDLPSTTTETSTTVSIENTPDFTSVIRLKNAKWDDDFADPSSDAYKKFTSKVENEIDSIFQKSVLKDVYNRTEVTSLEKGSVKCETETFVNRLSYYIEVTQSQEIKVKLETRDFKNAFEEGLKKHETNGENNVIVNGEYEIQVDRTTKKPEDVNVVCVSKSDIVFVLDESGSIGAGNFETTKHFAMNYSASAGFKENATQMGVVVFDDEARTPFKMNTYKSAGEIVSAINAIQYSGGNTNIGYALSYVNMNAFTAASGGRTDAFKIVILMTDGKSGDASAQAKVLKDKGIVIVCIGIGSGVDYNQLKHIVSKPEYVFNVTDFGALQEIEKILLKATCETKYNCSGEVMKMQPTGRKNGGVAASNQEVEADIDDIMRKKHCYTSAGRNNCIHPALIAAIASRESRAGRLLQSTNGYGDNGNSYGILQCDVSACPVCPDYTCTTFDWNSCEHIIMMTTKVVVPYIKQVQTKHPTWTPEQHIQGGVAAYNVGVSRVQSWLNFDVGTTDGDYSNDVMARAQYLVNKKIW